MRFHSTIEMQILWLKHSILKAFESVNTEKIDFFSTHVAYVTFSTFYLFMLHLSILVLIMF